ncbi:MAG: hypothetical protein MPN21_02280 [Thermoanaerobaculia bacterium]|nr:hypothetical protein [Thermoanaerobaculia bacterium]
MFEDTKNRILADGPSRLDKGLDERRAEIEDLEKRIAEDVTDDERSLLQTLLEELRAEYAPSDQAQRQSLF